MACMHSASGGCWRRCLIRALKRSTRHASYNKQQSFWSDKKWASHSSSHYASMHATQQGMLTNMPVSHWTLTLQALWTEKESKRGTTHSSPKWTTLCIVNDWQLSGILNLYLDNLRTMLHDYTLTLNKNLSYKGALALSCMYFTIKHLPG